MGLDHWINELGVTVHERLCPHGWWGYYDAKRHLVVLRPRLGAVQYRSTLAHELGHAFHRHVGTTPKQERQASEWAARVLVRHQDFERATAIFESVAAVANELNVLPRDVRQYAMLRRKSGADIVSRPTQHAPI